MSRAIKIGMDNTVEEVDFDLLNVPKYFDKMPQVVRTGRISDGIDKTTVGNLTEVRPVLLGQQDRHEETETHNEYATRLVVPKVDRFHGSVQGDVYLVGEGNVDIFDTQLTELPEQLTVKEVLRRINHYEDL